MKLSISDEDGIFTSVQEVFIEPKIEDHGKVIECKAVQLDGENKPLYEMKSAQQVTMNVNFPPQSASNQTLKTKKGSNLTVSFTFKSNPPPTNISWFITIPKVVVELDRYEQLRKELLHAADSNDAKNTSKTIELTPGHIDDKYDVSDIITLEDALTFRYVLHILSQRPLNVCV